MDVAANEGYRPGSNATWESGGNFWCEIVMDTSIESETIGALTAQLQLLAAKHGGEFDGWACAVKK